MPKLYIQEAAAGYTPTTFHGAWDASGSAITRAMALYPTPQEIMGEIGHSDTPLLKVAVSETSTNTSWDVCLLRLVSPPLAANITLDDPISPLLIFYESSTAADFYTHVHMWVTQGDSNLERGVLVTDYIGVTEWVTDTNARFVSIAPAITSVAAQAGDRIVIEFGYRATNASATSYTGTVWYGSSDGLLDGDTGLSNTSIRHLGAFYNPYVDVTDAIDFTITTRITALQAEVAVQAPDNVGTTRITQVAIEELVTQLATVRMTQMAIEVLVTPPSAVIPVTPIDVLPQARYQVRLYDTNGNLLAVILEYKHIEIEHSINNLSNHVISLDDDDPDVAKFGLDCFVEIYRTVDGTNWYLEYAGFHRTPQHQVTTEGHKIFTSYGRSYLDLVWRHHVLYQAKTAYTLKSGPAETVIKSFVTQNMTGIATSPPRVFSGVTPNFIVEADAATGSNWAGQRSWGNLLETIQEIASATDVQFDVRRLPPNTFEFYMKPYTDRSATVILAPEFGSMANPSYTYSRTEESNVIAVLGQGQNEKRRTYATQSAAVLDSPWNHIESTYDARNSDRLTDYMADAQTALTERAAKESFTFEAVQTATAAYGAHYFLGDVVTAKFASIVRRKMVAKVKIAAAGSVETVNLEFTDPPV